MGKFDKALEHIESAITFNPEEAKLSTTSGLVFYKLNKKDEAITDLKKAIDMGFNEAKEYLESFFKIDY